jgi:hypothetical protein
MSEQILCVMITVLIIALMFVWVPVLEFLCPPCGRALERFRSRKQSEVQEKGASQIGSHAKMM